MTAAIASYRLQAIQASRIFLAGRAARSVQHVHRARRALVVGASAICNRLAHRRIAPGAASSRSAAGVPRLPLLNATTARTTTSAETAAVNANAARQRQTVATAWPSQLAVATVRMWVSATRRIAPAAAREISARRARKTSHAVATASRARTAPETGASAHASSLETAPRTSYADTIARFMGSVAPRIALARQIVSHRVMDNELSSNKDRVQRCSGVEHPGPEATQVRSRRFLGENERTLMRRCARSALEHPGGKQRRLRLGSAASASFGGQEAIADSADQAYCSIGSAACHMRSGSPGRSPTGSAQMRPRSCYTGFPV